MLVKDVMNTNLVTINWYETMDKAIKLFKENDILLLPVLKEEKLVGLLTDSDIQKAYPSKSTSLDVYEIAYQLSKLTIDTIMNKNPEVIPDNYTIEEAAKIITSNKILGVIVVDEHKPLNILGIITLKELFQVVISRTGVGNTGIQIALEVEDRHSAIKEITDIVRSNGGRIMNILTSKHNVKDGYIHTYIRFFDFDRDKLSALKDEISKKTKLLYLIDYRDNVREIYY